MIEYQVTKLVKRVIPLCNESFILLFLRKLLKIYNYEWKQNPDHDKAYSGS